MTQEREQLIHHLFGTLNIDFGDIEESCPEIIQEFDEILDQYVNGLLEDQRIRIINNVK